MSRNLAAAKRQLRGAIAERRQAVTPAAAQAAARAVADHLLADPRVCAAPRVALYAALPDELPTRPLFQGLGALGRVRLLPRIREGEVEFVAVESWGELRPGFFGVLGKVRLLPRIRNEEIEFVAVESWAELRPGFFGVLEPPDGHLPVEPGAGDVAVVPGVAFDERGQRLGRGRGYYDRAFSGERGALPRLIGAGYEAQIVPAVPHDSRDRSMDAIVTERGLRWIPRDT
jgi:5-formyltetrahydrofolate cyclo-ligase